MSKDWEVVRRDDREAVMMPPTKQCLICGEFENPNASTVSDVGWLCPKCRSRLKRMLYPREGEWIRNGWSIRCSECGYDMPFTTRNFCPNCGAYMRGRS